MALLTVEDYEVASGSSLSASEGGRCQYYIDYLSDYLETRTGITFAKLVGVTRRVRADEYGEVLFDDYPVTAVTKIHIVKGDYDYDNPDDYWDGCERLYGFFPRQVLDVTYDCGLDPVGKALVGVAIEAVKRGMATTPTGLKSKTVGDVSYEYGDMLSFSEKEDEIICLYEQSMGTMAADSGFANLGRAYFNGLPVINQGDYDWGCL